MFLFFAGTCLPPILRPEHTTHSLVSLYSSNSLKPDYHHAGTGQEEEEKPAECLHVAKRKKAILKNCHLYYDNHYIETEIFYVLLSNWSIILTDKDCIILKCRLVVANNKYFLILWRDVAIINHNYL